MNKVSIILLNYNGIAFNKACLDSLLIQTYTNYEIIFVNNSSTDGSCEQVEKLFDNQIQQGVIKIVHPGYNSGFAQGNNIGVAHSDPASDYICLLNNDITAPNERLEKLVSGIQSNPKLGAVGSVIYDDGYENQMADFLFIQQKKGINNYFFDSVVVDQTKEDKEGNIIYTTGISGCCLLYKRSILNQPFDEIYFAYMEDTALSIKIILQGYRVGMVKDSIINHFGSASFGKKPNVFKSFHGLKNFMLNFILLSQGYYRIIILPFFIIGLLMRTLFNYPLIRLQGLAKAMWRILTHIPTLIVIRSAIHKTIKPKQLYNQLSAKFISPPFYTSFPAWYTSIIRAINAISVFYFRLWKINSDR